MNTPFSYSPCVDLFRSHFPHSHSPSPSRTVTNLTHNISHPSILTVAIRPHIMSSVTDLEAQQVTQAAPRTGAFFPLSHQRRSGNNWEKVVGGYETHEMD